MATKLHTLRDRRNLPPAIRARLEQIEAAGADEQVLFGARYGGSLLEERRRAFEFREADAAAPSLAGYAATFNQPYEVYGGAASGFGWEERVAPGAFDKTLREQDRVRLLLNHDGLPLADTSARTMQLSADDLGLLVQVPELDMASPFVQSVASAMRRGDLNQMSFAFEVTQQSWSPDYTTRTIHEVRLYDVSVVTYPANEATMALLASSFRTGVEVHSVNPTTGALSVRLAQALLEHDRSARIA